MMPSLPRDVWNGLSARVQSLVPELHPVLMSDGMAKVRWILPSRLALMGRRYVQALFLQMGNECEVRFERLFAEGGTRTGNWEHG
jgi:hypothetical protein